MMRVFDRAGALALALLRGAAILLLLLCVGAAGSLTAFQNRGEQAYEQLAAIHGGATTAGGRGQEIAAKPDYAAWLSVTGTQVDTPVAQLTDDMPANYYLTHDIWGERNTVGCPFIDSRSDARAAHILVFGHRIGWTDAAFTSLWDGYMPDRFTTLGAASWEIPSEDKGSIEGDGARRGEVVTFQPLCALHVEADYAAIQRFSFPDVDTLRSWLAEIANDATARAPHLTERIASAERVLSLVTCSEANGHSTTRTIIVFTSSD